MSVQQLKQEFAEVADSPNRLQPEMMKLALRLFSQIFVAEHPDTEMGPRRPMSKGDSLLLCV